MSREVLTRFVAEIARDPKLEKEFGGLSSGDDRSRGVPAGEFVSFAAGKGYEFTIDDLRSLGEELGDDALEAVTGGFSVARSGKKNSTRDRPTEEVAFYYNKITF